MSRVFFKGFQRFQRLKGLGLDLRHLRPQKSYVGSLLEITRNCDEHPKG